LSLFIIYIRYFSGAFEFVALPEVAALASRGYSTVAKEGTKMTLGDICFLANADILVGTFSSQISRLAFELMSAHRNITYVYAEKVREQREGLLVLFVCCFTVSKAAATTETPVVFETKSGVFRLPGPKHRVNISELEDCFLICVFRNWKFVLLLLTLDIIMAPL
jgi:hypothetical protein